MVKVVLTDAFVDCLLRRCSCEWHPNGKVQSASNRLWLAKFSSSLHKADKKKMKMIIKGEEEKAVRKEEAESVSEKAVKVRRLHERDALAASVATLQTDSSEHVIFNSTSTLM